MSIMRGLVVDGASDFLPNRINCMLISRPRYNYFAIIASVSEFPSSNSTCPMIINCSSLLVSFNLSLVETTCLEIMLLYELINTSSVFVLMTFDNQQSFGRGNRHNNFVIIRVLELARPEIQYLANLLVTLS